MKTKLKQSQMNKIALIIFFMAICIPILLFDGTMDDFVPKHIAKIEETIFNGQLIEGDNQVIQVPEFYILGAQICLITGLDSAQLISAPIQLIPYAILLFTLLYRLSGNPIISSLITFIALSSGTTGTPKVFFWPHGIGSILFYSILLLTLMLLRSDGVSKSSIFVAAVIVCSSLTYISYNYAAMTMILLVVILTILYLSNKISLKHADLHSGIPELSKTFSSICLIMMIVVFALSKFVYRVFIPTLQATRELELTGLDKFIIAYFNSNVSSSPLSPLMVNYPIAISIISGIKYAFLGLTLLIFVAVIFKTIIKEKPLTPSYLFLLSFILMTGIYAILRLRIGGIIITALWFPGILCLAHYFKMPNRFKSWACVVLSILLICTPSYYYIMEDNNLINRDDYQFSSYIAPTQWLLETNNEDLAVSDELTKNLFIYYTLTHYIDDSRSFGNGSLNYKIMPTDDALSLVQISKESLGMKYYILNQKTATMSLQNWIIIESWTHSEESINTNGQINKIYAVPQLSIYRTSYSG